MASTKVSSPGGLSPAEQQREAFVMLRTKAAGTGDHEIEELQKYCEPLGNIAHYQERTLTIIEETLEVLYDMQADAEKLLDSAWELEGLPLEVHLQAERLVICSCEGEVGGRFAGVALVHRWSIEELRPAQTGVGAL